MIRDILNELTPDNHTADDTRTKCDGCHKPTDEADLTDCEGSGLKVCWNKVCPECRQMVEELATCPTCAPVAVRFHAEQAAALAKALIADALKSTAEIEADTRRARQARAELAEIGEWFRLAG